MQDDIILNRPNKQARNNNVQRKRKALAQFPRPRGKAPRGLHPSFYVPFMIEHTHIIHNHKGYVHVYSLPDILFSSLSIYFYQVKFGIMNMVIG